MISQSQAREICTTPRTPPHQGESPWPFTREPFPIPGPPPYNVKTQHYMASATSPEQFSEIQLPGNKSKTATPCVKIRVQLNEGKSNLLLYPNFDTRVTLAGVSDITNETLVSGDKFPKYRNKGTKNSKA